MKLASPIRRGLVVVGVIGSLLVGVASIRAAAAWTASSAPLAVAPEPADALAARLADEVARSADLQGQLGALRSSTSDLTTALDAAKTQLTTDTTTATSLRKRLATAKAHLATLERSLAKARAAAAAAARTGGSTANPATGPAPASGGAHEVETDG